MICTPLTADSAAYTADTILLTADATEICVSGDSVDRDAKWLKKAAQEQRYIHYRERQVPEPVVEAIETVVERYEAQPPMPEQAAALLSVELEDRGLTAAKAYTDILLEALTRLHQKQIEDDEDEVNAALVMLLH